MNIRWAERIALMVVLFYLLLAFSAAQGGLGGQGLDPTWARVQNSGELRVAIDLGFAPFSWVVDDQVIGYDAELARAVAGRLGVRVGFVPTGFDSLYDALNRDQADMIASALPYTPQLGERARFSRFYFNAGQVLLAPRGSALAAANASFDGQRLGALLGSDGDTLLRRMQHQGSRLERHSQYDDAASLLGDLHAGQLDAAVLDNATALAASNDDHSLVLLRALTLDPYVLALPPNAYRLQSAVNQALSDLDRAGCMTALNQRWLRAQMPNDTNLPPACR